MPTDNSNANQIELLQGTLDMLIFRSGTFRSRRSSSRRKRTALVEYLLERHANRQLERKPDRTAAGHAGHADSAHLAMGSAARPRSGPGYPAQLGGLAQDRAGLALPRTAPAGGSRV